MNASGDRRAPLGCLTVKKETWAACRVAPFYTP
jgi:hypothetical protein